MSNAEVAADAPIVYPSAKRIDHVDDYHGTKVADPYRWLEDDIRTSNEVKEWVDAENKITNAYLQAIPQRAGIQKRLTELWNYEKYSAPIKVGGRYFFRKNDGLQNQAVLYVLDKLDGESRACCSTPNTWSKDGTVAAPAKLRSAPTANFSLTPFRRPVPIGKPGRSSMSARAKCSPTR